MARRTLAFEGALPAFDGPAELAVAVRLREGPKEWRHAPAVCELVQALAQIDGRDAPLVPVPDGRQFGNTQSYGSSWVVYKIRLGRPWSGKPLKLAVHAWLPPAVQARVEAFVVRRWWSGSARPSADGYYNDAPS